MTLFLLPVGGAITLTPNSHIYAICILDSLKTVSLIHVSVVPPSTVHDRRLDQQTVLLRVSPLFCLYVLFSVFCFRCSPWIPSPTLEQGERSLKGHTRLFLVLASLISYPDDAFCAFYDASLNTACRALSSEDGTRANFATFVEWTIGEKRISVPRRISPVPLPTQCPAHHLPAALSPEPATTDEPLPHGATELRIAPELRFPSDQVQETGNHARHEEESRGQWDRGEELRPLQHDWGWAVYGSG